MSARINHLKVDYSHLFIPIVIALAMLSYIVFAEYSTETGLSRATSDSLRNEAEIQVNTYSYDQALVLLKHAIAIDTSQGRQQELAYMFLRAGEIYYKTSEYDSSLLYARFALIMAKNFNDSPIICAAYKSLGEAYEALCEYEKALTYCDSALLIARQSKNKHVEGRALTTIGVIHNARGTYEKALAYSDSALILCLETSDSEGQANALNNAGITFDAICEYDSALNVYRSALRINKQIQNLAGQAANLGNIGRIYYHTSQYDSAFVYYNSALHLRRQTKDIRGEGSTLNNIGLVHYNLSEFNNALAYFDSAVLRRKQVKDNRGMCITMYNIGIVYSAISKYDSALTYYGSALALTRKIGSLSVEGSALNSIGSSHYALGNYEKAVAYYDSALVIERKITDRFAESATLNNIAIVYHDLAIYERAMIYYDSSLAIKRQIRARQSEGTVLSNMGSNYRALRQYDRALAYFDSALQIEYEFKDLRGKAYNHDNIGVVYYELGRYDSSLVHLYSSLRVSREVCDRRQEGTALLNIGRSYCALQDYDRAQSYYDSALAIMREINDICEAANTIDHIGQLYEKVFDIENAIVHYKEAIGLKESLRKKLKRAELQTAYIEAEKDVYERLIILLIMLERYEEAFDYLERSHSERLRRAFEQGEMVAYDPSLHRILERINYLETEMEGLRSRYNDREISKRFFEEEQSKIEGRINQQFIDMKVYHADLYNIMVPQRRTLKYVQNNMPDNTMFLEYVLVGDTYVALLFTRDIFLAKSISEPADTINRLVLRSLRSLKLRVEQHDVDEYYEELYDILIKPIENELASVPNIVIIPYGVLHYLPFHALRRKEHDKAAEYFMVWRRISYLPSASFLIDLLEEQEHAEKEMLAFGNADGTLPSAEIEVDLIAQIFDNCCVCKCDSARKDRFIDICGDYRLIHLATHGILNADPRFSYIVMAPAQTGNLTVREILGLSGCFKRTSLVTLSACETGVEEDPEQAGMELVTLSNAFKVAGVPSTIASLWEIADRSTALLMESFYENLKTGSMDKIESLRQAQISMTSHERYSHPYYWAPFILIGDWR